MINYYPYPCPYFAYAARIGFAFRLGYFHRHDIRHGSFHGAAFHGTGPTVAATASRQPRNSFLGSSIEKTANTLSAFCDHLRPSIPLYFTLPSLRTPFRRTVRIWISGKHCSVTEIPTLAPVPALAARRTWPI